jgi:hypothetical protein
MKNKKIIYEQAEKESLKKFFYPGCFTYGDPATDNTKASIVPVDMGGKRTYAIKKQSKQNPGTFGYFMADGFLYTIKDGKFQKGQPWECPSAGTPAANPAISYFNRLGLDLTLPDNVETLKEISQKVSNAVKRGGTGNDIRTFIKFVNILREDENFKSIPEIPQMPDGQFTSGFTEVFGREWTMADPDPNEMPRFTKYQIPLGNGQLVYYIWKGGQSTARQGVQYDPQGCYNNLVTYYQRSQSEEASDIQTMPQEKQAILACYRRFWQNGELLNKSVTGIKLGIGGKQKRIATEVLKRLLADTGEWGIDFGNPKRNQTIQYESLDKRLHNILKETIDHKKKDLIEGDIVSARFSILTENVDYTKMENFDKAMTVGLQEVNYLMENGYTNEVINENFFSWLKGLIGGTISDSPNSLTSTIKEYIGEWLAETLGAKENTFIKNTIIAAVGNIGVTEYGKLFTDCEFTSNVISKSLVEGFLRQLTEKKESLGSGAGGFIVTTLRNSLADQLFEGQDSYVKKVQDTVNSFICPKLKQKYEKMGQVQQEMTEKVLS